MNDLFSERGQMVRLRALYYVYIERILTVYNYIV